MDCWPPKNGESSTAAQKYSERSSNCDSSNRVIMLQGLDPNSTQGRIKKAFEDNGLKVTVDYQRDETIGYVHLHLPMAKEVVSRITTSGGLRIGSEYVVLRALEGTEEVMYWSVYAAANLPTSFRSPGKNKKSSGRIRNKMRNRSHPYSSSYQTMDIDDDVNQAFEKTLSKLQKKKNSRLKRTTKGHKKPKKLISNRTAAKQFHMQLKATINMDITSMSVVNREDALTKMCLAEEALNSFLKKEGINNDMSRSAIISERSSDYSLQSIQNSQSLTTNSSGMFGICSPYQHSNYQQTAFGMEIENETRENVHNQFFIKVANKDETDEVEEKFKSLSVNSLNEFSSEYYHN
ncbi:hypothetical protein C1645_740106 [Glomus cerebriforme]|uniref:XRRM domain-containing protein n=1 Tax=Glomus cerebriforme TaxID=658196 RepID=A0A397STY3_9GLOM|nr:hypothetical protein C1645_740106 [Glomus cerebriforme]